MKKFRALVFRGKFVTTGEGAWLEVDARSANHARRLFERAVEQPHDVKWSSTIEVEIGEEDRAEIQSIEEATDE